MRKLNYLVAVKALLIGTTPVVVNTANRELVFSGPLTMTYQAKTIIASTDVVRDYQWGLGRGNAVCF